MSTVILQASLPWSVSYEEDRRFYRILLQTLAVCLLVGTITHYVPIPEPDSSDIEELPPRRVYLLEEQIKPVPKPLPVPVAPVVTAPVKPKPRPEPLPAPPKITPRQKAASSGVLAMSDALAELHSTAPKTDTRTSREGAADEVNAIPPQPALLTANLSRVSKGIELGVEHQSVLGATGLPERVDRQQDYSSPGGGAASGRISAPPSAVRSEEEIQEILDRHKGAIYTLYNRELRQDATLQGKMVMSITIAPSGKVTRCSTVSNEVGSLGLERQLIALLQRIDFGDKPGVPIVTTRIPIEFFPL